MPPAFATSVIFGPARAFETGQPFFAAAACSWNAASVNPGTTASVESSISVIVGPSPRCTAAVVLMRTGAKPASVSRADRNIEKHPA